MSWKLEREFLRSSVFASSGYSIDSTPTLPSRPFRPTQRDVELVAVVAAVVAVVVVASPVVRLFIDEERQR